MISLGTRSSPKDHATAFATKLSHPLQLCSLAFFPILFAATCSLFGAEPALCFAMPDDERCHDILISRRPAVFEVDTWESVVTWFVRIEGLVLVEEVVFREETRIDVAILEIEIRYALVVDVRQLFADPASQDISKDQQRTGGQQNATSCKGRVYAGLPIQHSAHMDTATTSDATHVVELW